MKKSVNLLPLTGKMNLDSSQEAMPQGDYKEARNFINNSKVTSDVGIGGNMQGNVILTQSLLETGDRNIGSATYGKENKSVEFYYNTDASKNKIILINNNSSSLLIKGSFLNFQDELMNNPKCYDDYIVFTDNTNEPRMFNVQWVLNYNEQTEDSGNTLYFYDAISGLEFINTTLYYIYDGEVYKDVIGGADRQPALPSTLTPLMDYNKETYYKVDIDSILLIAKQPENAPSYKYVNDESYNNNKLFGKLYKFAYRYVYLDGRKSVYSPISEITYPLNEETGAGYQLSEKNNNAIQIYYNTGSENVSKIEIAVIASDNESSVSIIKTVDKYSENGYINTVNTIKLTSNLDTYTDNFYNNEAYLSETSDDLYKLHDFIPSVASSLDILSDGRILLGDMKYPSLGDSITDMDARVVSVLETQEAATSASVVVEAITASIYHPTAPFTFGFKRLKFDFPDGYTSGLVLEFSLNITLGGVIYFNGNVSIPLPYDKYLTESENKKEGLLYVSHVLREYANAYVIEGKKADGYPKDGWEIIRYGSPATDFRFTPFYYSSLVGETYPPYAPFPNAGGYEGDVVCVIGTYIPSRSRTVIEAASIHGAFTDDDLVMLEWGYQTSLGVGFEQVDAIVDNSDGVYRSSGWSSDSTLEITSVVISAADELKYESLKSNDILNVGIEYKDENYRSLGVAGFTQLKTLPYDFGTSDPTNYFQVLRQIPEIDIFHIPPVDAYYYNFVISRSVNVNQSLMFPVEDVGTYQVTRKFVEVNQMVLTAANTNNNFVPSPWVYQNGDKIRHVANWVKDNEYDFTNGDTYDILNFDEADNQFIVDGGCTIAAGDIVELYRDSANIVDDDDDIYFEIGQTHDVRFPGTSARAHSGNQQNQVVANEVSTQFATTKVYYGNVYLNKAELYNETQTATYTVMLEQENFSNYYQSNFYDKGKPIPYIKSPVTEFSTMLRFGGRLLPQTNNNYIARFDWQDYVELSNSFGSITGIRMVGYTIFIAQGKKVTTYYLNKSVIKEADGGEQLVLSDEVLNNANVSNDDYGCINQESITVKGRDVIFFDANNGCFVRHSPNGMVNISEYGLAEFSRTLGESILAQSGSRFDVVGMYDERSKMYYWNIYNATTHETVSFRNDNNKNEWNSFHDFFKQTSNYVENLGSLNNAMISYIGDEIFIHNSSVYGKFFGEYKETSVTVVANADAIYDKVWDYIEVNSNKPWTAGEDGDVSVDRDVMVSRLKQLIQKESSYVGAFKKNVKHPDGTIDYTLINNGERLRGKTIAVTLRFTPTLVGQEKITISSVKIVGTFSEKI